MKEKDKLKKKSDKKSDKKKKSELKEKKIPKNEKKKKEKKKQKEELLLQEQPLQETTEAVEEMEVPVASAKSETLNTPGTSSGSNAQEIPEISPGSWDQKIPQEVSGQALGTQAEPKPSKRVSSKPSGQPRRKTDAGSTKMADVPADQKLDCASREAQALIFRALGDEIRLQILEMLEEQEMCAADILKLLPIVQSTLSHHMKILCEAQLVLCRREGRWSYYVLNRPIFQEAAAQLIERSK